jgi:hypothetical protein
MQAPGKPEQHLPTARRAPARIAVLGVGTLGDDAIALALADKPAHAGRPADPGDETHGFIVSPCGPRTTGSVARAFLEARGQLALPGQDEFASQCLEGRYYWAGDGEPPQRSRPDDDPDEVVLPASASPWPTAQRAPRELADHLLTQNRLPSVSEGTTKSTPSG